jgi:hypothetical protein
MLLAVLPSTKALLYTRYTFVALVPVLRARSSHRAKSGHTS